MLSKSTSNSCRYGDWNSLLNIGRNTFDTRGYISYKISTQYEYNCTCDPKELEDSLNIAATSLKDLYRRIEKLEPTFVNKKSEKWKFGKIRKIVSGSDLCILTFGPIMKKAFELREKFLQKGKSIEVNSCHTLKPFDYLTLKKKFNKFKKIVIIEDHSEIGGLNAIVKEAAYEYSYKGKIFSFSLKDQFITVMEITMIF